MQVRIWTQTQQMEEYTEYHNATKWGWINKADGHTKTGLKPGLKYKLNQSKGNEVEGSGGERQVRWIRWSNNRIWLAGETLETGPDEKTGVHSGKKAMQ